MPHKQKRTDMRYYAFSLGIRVNEATRCRSWMVSRRFFIHSDCRPHVWLRRREGTYDGRIQLEAWNSVEWPFPPGGAEPLDLARELSGLRLDRKT